MLFGRMKSLAAATCSIVMALIVSRAPAAEVAFDQARLDAARSAGKPDKTLEAWILDRSPAWLTAVTTRY
jgi:hypothetical protein